MVGLMLVTGWYAVMAMATRDKLIAEVWNPMEVYPDWDSQGMYSVAHVFTITSAQAGRLFKQRDWAFPDRLRGRNITIWDLWEITDDGVINATVAENVLVKPETIEPFVDDEDLPEIPILCGPVGGLPDDGAISANRRQFRGTLSTPSGEWRANVGQSILAVNADIYKNHNRMVTFMQQILRDTAQPKYWEKSRGNVPILTPEDLEKRGPIFRLGADDDIGTVAMPGIPVELTALINLYEQMIQQGSLPRALSGQVENIPLGLMSQVAASAMKALSPFHKTIQGILTDIDNAWLGGLLDGTFQVETLTLPQDVPIHLFRFDIFYPISIPGDLVQRATIMRMTSPSARISATTALDLFFPEIANPQEELANARADDAQANPVFAILNLISALREEAALLRQTGNNDDADLLDRAQEVLITQITQGGQGQQPPSNGAGGIPPSGLSPNAQALLAQSGITAEQQNA